MKSLFRTALLAVGLIFSICANAQTTRGSIEETGGNIIVHLETASWGQNAPFNNQCWTSKSHTTHAKTGCVPTAYAIVMRYHEWPKEGIGNLYDCQKGTIITDRTYNWENMPLIYDNNATNEQKNNVAKIMSHLGHAFMVEYGQSSTGVSDPKNTEKPSNFFDYKNVDASYQANYNKEEWEAKIKESLNKGCPIVYAANNSGTGDSRHMFVIDGYTDNGYFHFNFGWNGSGNGWFKLDAIKPAQGDDYSWNSKSDHYAIFNFMPNKPRYAVTATASPADAGTVSINNGTAGNDATAELFENATATLTATANNGYAFVNWTVNGEVISTEKSININVTTTNNIYVANFKELSATAVEKEYIVSPSSGTLNKGTSKSSVWTSTQTEEYPVELTITTTSNDVAVNAMSVNSGKFKYYAYAWDENENGHGNIKYTLSVPQGYTIKDYNITYWVSSNNKGKITITNEEGTEIPTDTDDHYLSATPNAQTAEFSLSVQDAGQQYITIENFIVTISSEAYTETGINSIDSTKKEIIYDIRGRKLEKMTEPGIYIVNGKKILKK